MKGFTLIELVLSIALIGIMAFAIGPGLAAGVKSYDLITTRKQMLGSSRAGMDRMVREIRLIPGSAQVTSIGASSFQFQYPAGTSITYSLSGTNLMRNSDILISDVSALTFTYYGETDVVTATAASVRSVGIQFTSTGHGSIPSYTLRTRVFLRNTGNNYANYTTP